MCRKENQRQADNAGINHVFMLGVGFFVLGQKVVSLLMRPFFVTPRPV